MKKLLVVSAIAALGLNSVVLAGGLPEEMPVAPAAMASSEQAVYMGLEGGYGMTNWKSLDGIGGDISGSLYGASYSARLHTATSNDNGFVGRVFLGYDINRYFALEAGYTYFFNKPKLKVDMAASIKVPDILSVSESRSDEWKVKSTQVIDVMGKIKAPVVENFNLYAKFGVNYMMTNQDGSSNVKNFNVAYGAGADYYITPNIIANVEWLRFNGNEKLNEVKVKDGKYQPHTDAFMVGFRYAFDL